VHKNSEVRYRDSNHNFHRNLSAIREASRIARKRNQEISNIWTRVLDSARIVYVDLVTKSGSIESVFVQEYKRSVAGFYHE